MAGGTHLLAEGHSTGFVEDLRFPASSINPTGLTGAAGIDTNTGHLLFDGGSSVEMCAGVAQFPHGLKAGSLVTPHIHIRASVATDPATGGNNSVRFKLEYKWYNTNEVTPSSYSDDTKDFTLPNHSGGQPVNYMGNFTAISSTGKTASSIMEWRLTRLCTADTYPDDCVLLEFDIHYYHYRLGS